MEHHLLCLLGAKTTAMNKSESLSWENLRSCVESGNGDGEIQNKASNGNVIPRH